MTLEPLEYLLDVAVEATTVQEAGERIEVGTGSIHAEHRQHDLRDECADHQRGDDDQYFRNTKGWIAIRPEQNWLRSHRDHKKRKSYVRDLQLRVVEVGDVDADQSKNDTGEQSCELGGISNDGDRDRDVAEDHETERATLCGAEDPP